MRAAGVAGVLGPVLAVVGSVVVGAITGTSVLDMPPSDASGAEVAAFAAEDRGAAFAALVLNALGVAGWLVFGAGVWLRMRAAAGGETLASACFALGLAGFVTLILAGFVPFFLLGYRTPGPDDAKLLYDLTFGLLAMSGLPTAVALGAYAAATWRGEVLPRSTAWLAALAAAAHVVLLASFAVEEGFFSLQGQVISVIPGTLFAWVLWTAIALLRDTPSTPRTVPAAPAG